MSDMSEEQVIDRLFDFENEGLAEQRAELTGERFLSLINDEDNGRAYVFQHGVDDTEGAEVPAGTEFFEYPNLDEAQRAYRDLLREARENGELLEEDSDDDLGDSETAGAEVRGRYSGDDDDSLIEESDES